MKYLENLGLLRGNLIKLDDVQNAKLKIVPCKDFFKDDIIEYSIYWNTICNIEEDISFRKTIEGNKFYEDIKEFISSKEFSKRFLRTYSYEYDIKNNNIKNRVINIYSYNFYDKALKDKNQVFKYSVLLPYFVAFHFYDFFGKYGYDVKVNKFEKNVGQEFWNMFSSNEVKEKFKLGFLNEGLYHLKLAYKTVNGIDYYRDLDKSTLEKFSNILDEIYNVYIKSFENTKIYSFEQFKSMIKNLRLLEIDIDEILNKYKNITKEDIYKLLIYNTNSSNFDSYLNVLNVCSNEVKQKIFDFIKPSIYYFQYLPNNWNIYVGTYSGAFESFYSVISDIKEFYKSLSPFLTNNFYSQKKEFAYNFRNKIEKDDQRKYLANRFYEAIFENVLFNGYMDFALTFRDVFVNKIDIIEKIILDNDLSKLDTLLQMKQKILLNPIKTKLDFSSSGIRTDNTKILELKDTFDDACKELVNVKTKSLKK